MFQRSSWAVMAVVLLGASGLTFAAATDASHTEAWFEAHRTKPGLLRQFLQQMPKGADLHSHLSGAVYAEDLLRWSAEDGSCVNVRTLAITLPCEDAERSVPLRGLAEGAHAPVYRRLVDRMSTRNLSVSGRSGHDQFFDAFKRFPPGMGSAARQASMAGTLRDRAAADHVLHLELMTTFQHDAVIALADLLPWSPETDLSVRLDWLGSHGLGGLVTAASRHLDDLDAAQAVLQQCGTPAARPGCGVTMLWLQQSTRAAPPERVFAQLAFAFALAASDGRVGGINLLAPEDDPVALRDHSLHLEMIRFLSTRMPGVRVALHAGELALGLVPPEHLRNHVHDAVGIAGAQRIGHGVDIDHEADAPMTMAAMRRRGVAVEICLTSNELILGVRGRDHPLMEYLAAGVPVVLATDDAGVSRIDLSHEYLRASTEHGLGYRELRQLSRNSLQYSFLPGESLWQDLPGGWHAAPCRRDRSPLLEPSAGCREFLRGSERARRQWALERDFVVFEALPPWGPVRARALSQSPPRRTLATAPAR